MSSIVVACRKITEDSEEFFQDIIPRVEDDIKAMITKIPDDRLLTLPITDLLIMVYGKVLESCTKHTVLKSRSADIEPNFEMLLGRSTLVHNEAASVKTHQSKHEHRRQ